MSEQTVQQPEARDANIVLKVLEALPAVGGLTFLALLVLAWIGWLSIPIAVIAIVVWLFTAASHSVIPGDVPDVGVMAYSAVAYVGLLFLTAIFMAPVEEGSVWPLVFLFGGPLVFVIAVVSALYYGLRRVVSQKVFRPINDRIAKKALADRDRLEKRREPEVLLYIAGLANQENRTMHPDDFSSKYVHKLEDMLALAEERDAFIQHLSSFSQSRHYEPAQRTIAKVKAAKLTDFPGLKERWEIYLDT